MSAMIPFFSSCSDDDSVNEWDMSYVSLIAGRLFETDSFVYTKACGRRRY